MITLVILGIIAAMTIPTIKTKVDKEVTVVSLKKAYSELYQVIQKSALENGPTDDWDYTLSGDKFFKKYYQNYIAVVSSETVAEAKQRLNITYKKLSGAPENNYVTVYDSATILTTQSGFQFFLPAYTAAGLPPTRRELLIDINGYKAPNTIGKDIFSFYTTNEGKLEPCRWDDWDASTVTRTRTQLLNGPSSMNYQCNKQGRGQWCGALIMLDGWKITDDYPW